MPHLFFGILKYVPPIVGSLNTMSVKKYGLFPANYKYLSLLRVISNLIGIVTGEREFFTADHIMALRDERRDRQNILDDSKEAKLKGRFKDTEAIDCHLILCA